MCCVSSIATASPRLISGNIVVDRVVAIFGIQEASTCLLRTTKALTFDLEHAASGHVGKRDDRRACARTTRRSSGARLLTCLGRPGARRLPGDRAGLG